MPRKTFKLLFIFLLAGCGTSGKIETIRNGGEGAHLSLNDGINFDTSTQILASTQTPDTLTVTGLNGEKLHLMRSVTDSLGNIYGSENLSGVVVSAKFRNIAERGGKIELSFDVKIPKEIQDLSWRLRFRPRITTGGDTLELDELYITGIEYINRERERERKYNEYLSSIIRDTTKLRHHRLMEIFLERNGTGNLTYREIAEHYQKDGAVSRNNRKIEGIPRMQGRFLPAGREEGRVKLDSVITQPHDITYCYTHTLQTNSNIKKLRVFMDGDIVRNGETIHSFPEGTPLSFYVSSLNHFAEHDTPHQNKGYTEGLTALNKREYRRAAALLGPYHDMNSVIAHMNLGEDARAEEILMDLPASAKRDYMLAIIYANKGDEQRAVESLLHSVERDRSFTFRANLDPEISRLVKKYNINF